MSRRLRPSGRPQLPEDLFRIGDEEGVGRPFGMDIRFGWDHLDVET